MVYDAGGRLSHNTLTHPELTVVDYKQANDG
jgi:hypothetical protein